jgi:NAD(P)-dependent dehydrogenase (short-subunit alcohol dehydrogenase family)
MQEVMVMEVLVTGGDTDLGRTVAENFRDAGHRVVIAGARRDDLKVVAKELDVDAIVLDNTDPVSLEEARGQFPRHLDTIVNVPAPRWDAGDPRTYSLADLAAAWRNTMDAYAVSAVLTVQILGDHLRSGGSIVTVIPEHPREGSAEAAVKAAISDWTAGQATHFGTRGITVNVVASGRSAEPGYDGLSHTPAPVAAEIARLALFLTAPAARHITGQTLHVSQGALANFG